MMLSWLPSVAEPRTRNGFRAGSCMAVHPKCRHLCLPISTRNGLGAGVDIDLYSSPAALGE